MVKGLPLILLPLIRTWSLCGPCLTAVYETSYLEGDVMTTAAEGCRTRLVGVACEEVDCRTSSAVTFWFQGAWPSTGVAHFHHNTCWVVGSG